MRRITCGVAFLVVGLLSTNGVADPPRLDLNDVSWLFPVPNTVTDLSDTIAIDTLKSPDGAPVWSDDQFADVLKTADSDAAAVGDIRIRFQQEFRSKAVWHIAAFRFDPSAPGCGQAVRDAFGSVPQIRLILQPVTIDGQSIEVHDVAVHLVYSFLSGLDKDHRFIPDRDKTLRIIHDLDDLKKLSEDADATTSGLPLMVHPGLTKKVSGLRAKVAEFLAKHLDASHLSAMALMGIEPPEPWIFVAMSKPPGASHFMPVPSLPAEMIGFRGPGLIVRRTPKTSNRSPITSQPIDEKARRGVATAALFGTGIPSLDSLATVATSDAGVALTDAALRNTDIPDYIANPAACHFFNTDCVSCHTETRRRLRLRLPVGPFAFLKGGAPPIVADSVLPKDDWNVRNFGWFPPSPFIGGGPTVATATQRTANETADVVEFIEGQFRHE